MKPRPTEVRLDALVLAELIEAQPDFLSGQALCDKFDLPRASLLRRIDSLRARGFSVQSVAGRGYKLDEIPDEIWPDQLIPLLSTDELGRTLYVHRAIGSTNEEAHRLAEAGTPHGTTVIAEEQTAGRGRRERGWVSPPGTSLSLSVVLRPALSAAEAPELALVAAVAVCEAARELGAKRAQVKWPNDVECEGRKLAGLLAELRTSGDRVTHVVLGIGLNVNLRAEDFPEALRPLATSLLLETGAPVPRPLVCARVLWRLEHWLEVHEGDGFAPVRDRVCQLSSTLGRRVRVDLGANAAPLLGQAVDLGEDGALIVETDDGQRHTVTAGDVEHCRPA